VNPFTPKELTTPPVTEHAGERRTSYFTGTPAGRSADDGTTSLVRDIGHERQGKPFRRRCCLGIPNCSNQGRTPAGIRRTSLVRLDELVRPLLVANDLTDAIEVALERVDGDDERGLETFEFSGPTRYVAIIGGCGHPVALLEQLVAVLVDVSTEPVNLGGLRRRIRQAAELTTSTHVVEYGISRLV